MEHDIDSFFLFSGVDGKIKIEDFMDEETCNFNENLNDPLAIENKTAVPKPALNVTVNKKLKRASKNLENCRRSKRVKLTTINKEIYSENENHHTVEHGDIHIPEKLLKKLKNLKIKIQHRIPPQHLIESRAGTKPLTVKEKHKFEACGLLKVGAFTKEEDQLIKKNWKHFCEIHEWPLDIVQPFTITRCKGKYFISTLYERQQFVRFLANELPWRSLYSVYSRFKCLYNKSETVGLHYSKAEDAKILSLLDACTESDKRKEKRCVLLGKLLRRNPHSVWYRYQRLKSVHKNVTTVKKVSSKSSKYVKTFVNKSEENPSDIALQGVFWEIPLVEKFVKILLKKTFSKNVYELKNAFIPKYIWKQIEIDMCVNEQILKWFWFFKLHMQLFCPEPILLNEIKIKLIEYIYIKGITDKRQICWRKLLRHFEGCTTYFLQRTFYSLLSKASKYSGLCKFKNIIGYLHKEKIPQILESDVNHVLLKLNYIDGKIVVDDEVNSKVLQENSVNDKVSSRECLTTDIQSHSYKDAKILESISWTIPLVEKFFKILMQKTFSKDIFELKNAIIPRYIWQQVATEMNMDYKFLNHSWFQQFHMQVFSPEPLFLNETKIRLIEYMYVNGINNVKDICWRKVLEHFEGCTSVFLIDLFEKLVTAAAKNSGSYFFRDIIEYLHNTEISQIISHHENKVLIKLRFINNRIIIDEEINSLMFPTYGFTDKTKSHLYENIRILESTSWTVPLVEKFLKILLEKTFCKDISELKNAIIPRYIWKQVASEMHIDYKFLNYSWFQQFHMQLFCPEQLFLNETKIRLVEYMYVNGIANIKDISWRKVLKHFEGCTSVFLIDVLDKLITDAKLNSGFHLYQDIIEYLYNVEIPKIILRDENKALTKLRFINNRIIFDQEINSLKFPTYGYIE